MNQKGILNFISGLKNASLMWKILIVFLFVILLIPLITSIYPITKYIIMLIIGFIIYGMVSEAFGNSIITFIIVGILLYFILFKYFFVSSTIFLFYFFLMYGFLSVFIWGTARFGR